MRNLVIFLAALFALAVSGCGGSSGGSGSGAAGRGTLSLTIKWPVPTRLIPVASLSIEAVLTDSSNNPLGTHIIARPTSGNTTTVSFVQLPAGNVTLTATAYPTTTGAGTGVVAQAVGAAGATIVAGQTASVTVTMVDTIDHIQIINLGGGNAGGTLTTGVTQNIGITAFDATNEVVLTSPTTITYAVTSGSAYGSVTNAGLVTMLASGSTNEQFSVTATETESGKVSPPVVYQYIGTTLKMNPTAILVDTSGTHLYAMVDTAIHVFNINQTTGVLTFSQEISAPGANTLDTTFYQMVLSLDGTHLYAYAPDTQKILSYNVSSADGTLTAVGSVQGPINSRSITTDPSGKFLYAGGVDNVTSNPDVYIFTINSDGTLTNIGTQSTLTSSIPIPLDMANIPGSNLMLGGVIDTSLNKNMVTMTVNSTDGTLTLANATVVGTSSFVTYAGPFTLTPDGTKAFSYRQDLSSYTIAGQVVSQGVTVNEGISRPFVACNNSVAWMRAYVGQGGSSTLSQEIIPFTISSSGGLSPLAATATNLPVEQLGSLALTPNGKFLYASNLNDNSISEYSVNSDNSLTPLSPAKVTG